MLLQPVYARVTECLARASRLQTCSARYLDDCHCWVLRPSTRWRSPRFRDDCRRRNVSTHRYSAESCVGQSCSLTTVTLSIAFS